MASAPQPADHAERMDGVYAFQRHIYDLTRKYYLLGRDGLLDGMNPPDGGTVLEVGCGTGRNLILAARKYPASAFHGLDISAEMLKTAQAKLTGNNLAKRVSLTRADATRFDPQALFGRPHFDRVFLSYTLSMIPDWQGALHMAVRVLGPGSELHIVDFGMQRGLPRWFGRLLGAWLARFHVERREGLEAFCKQLAGELGLACDVRHLYRGYAVAVTLRKR